MNRENISARLRQARIRAGYTYAAEAARAMGVNTQTYSAHENGNRGMDTESAARYVSFFKVSLEWLLTGKPEPGQPTIPLAPVKANATNLDRIATAAALLAPLFEKPPSVAELAWEIQQWLESRKEKP